MQAISLYESDLYAMQQVFFPDAKRIAVYDPEEEVKHNFTSGFIAVRKAEAIPQCDLLICIRAVTFKNIDIQNVISLNELPTDLSNKEIYYYINNTYGTMRWVWQQGLRKPVFLEMNGTEGQFSMFFTFFSGLVLRIGKAVWISDGCWHIYSSQPIRHQYKGIDYEQLAFFSGRMMLNNKITLQFIKNNIPAWYAHLLLSAKSEKLKHQEYCLLEELNKQQWKYLQVPELRQIKGMHYLSNIFSHDRSATVLRQQHIRAVGEYTERFMKLEKVEDYISRKNIFNRLVNIFTSVHFPAGISIMRLEELFLALRKAQHSLALNEEIEVSLAHKDFSHWNSRITGEKLALIDWEKADWQTVRYYDLLYFAFQEAEREEHYDLKALKQQVGYIQKNITTLNNNWHTKLLVFSLEYFVSKLEHILKQHILPYTFNQQLYLWQLWLQEL